MSFDAKLLLFEYIKQGNLKDAFILLQQGLVSTNTTNLAGFTALHYAVLSNRENAVQLILQFKPDLNIRNNYDCGFYTPLISAIRNDNLRIAKLLLDVGANPNLEDKQGFTPLHHATRAGNVKAVQLLIEHCADVNKRDQFGFNAYYYANLNGFLEGNKELAELLGQELKVTTADVRAYREDFKRVHQIVDRRIKAKPARRAK